MVVGFLLLVVLAVVSSLRQLGVHYVFVRHFACEAWSREGECYWRNLLTYWALSKNKGSTALAIGLLGLAKLNRSIENFDFLLSIALLRPTKSTIARVNRAIDFLAIKNDKKCCTLLAY